MLPTQQSWCDFAPLKINCVCEQSMRRTKTVYEAEKAFEVIVQIRNGGLYRNFKVRVLFNAPSNYLSPCTSALSLYVLQCTALVFYITWPALDQTNDHYLTFCLWIKLFHYYQIRNLGKTKKIVNVSKTVVAWRVCLETKLY